MRLHLGFLSTAALIAATGCPHDIVVFTASDGDDLTTSATTAVTTGTSGEATTSTTTTTGDSPTTGGPAYDGVAAPVVRTYWPRSGSEVDVAHDPLPDLTSVEIVAGGQQFPAVFDGDDRLLFAGVPEVTYLLRQQHPPHPAWPGTPGRIFGIFTAARELGNYGGIYSGRPDVAQTNELATRIELSATAMQALGAEDEFEIYSYNADAQVFVFPDLDPMEENGSPGLGETEIVAWSVPWRPEIRRSGWPLVDPNAGDDLWLAHLVAGRLVENPTDAQLQDAWSYAQVYSLAEVAALSLSPMVGDATTPASGTFAPVEAKTATLDLRASEFMAELQVYDSTLKSVGCFVSVVLEPGISHPILGRTPALGGVNAYGQDVPVDPMCPPDTCDPDLCDSCDSMFAMPGDRLLDLEYGNPYAGGTETLVVQCSRYVFVEDPNGMEYDWLASDLVVAGRLADLAQGPIAPKIGLVRELAVNGVEVPPDQTLENVGTTPTITFTAPKFGAPDYYSVTVRTIDDFDGADGVVKRRALGTIRTAFTSLTLPEGLLEPGGHYYIQVSAERGRGLTEAVPYSHDSYVSRAMTGIITP